MYEIPSIFVSIDNFLLNFQELMVILKENGYKFPSFKMSYLKFSNSCPDCFCSNCDVGFSFYMPVNFCVRCLNRICENCMTKSSFPDFNLLEEIQVCTDCFKNLTVPVSANEAFRLRIQELIKEQKTAVNKGNLFKNCKNFESFYRSGRFSDLRLVSETGKVFKAHKLVLAGKYFDPSSFKLYLE
jgi:hypothetical protein